MTASPPGVSANAGDAPAGAGEGTPPGRPRLRRLRRLLLVGGVAVLAGAGLRLVPWLREDALARAPLPELARRAAQSPRDPLVLYYQGRALLKSGSPEQAAPVFYRAIEADVTMVRAYTGLGRSLAAQGRTTAAQLMFQDAVRLAPRDPTPRLLLAKLYAERGRFAEAVSEMEAAARLEPRRAPIWYTLAQVYASASRQDESLEALERAVKLDPRQAEYWRDLGRAYGNYSRLDDAERCFKRALASRPGDPQVLLMLGQVYLRKPDTAESRRQAEETLRASLKLAPDQGEGHLKLGELLLRVERLPDAEREFRRALALSPEQDQTLSQLGQTLLRQGRRAEGTRYLQRFEEARRFRETVDILNDEIAHTPQKADLWLRLARLYRRHGDTSQAAPAYRRYLALKPGDSRVRKELAQCQPAAGKGTSPAGSAAAPRPALPGGP
jgi:tetratricopeptide (TPR) repeat protein